jgi:hypothetical protein
VTCTRWLLLCALTGCAGVEGTDPAGPDVDAPESELPDTDRPGPCAPFDLADPASVAELLHIVLAPGIDVFGYPSMTALRDATPECPSVDEGELTGGCTTETGTSFAGRLQVQLEDDDQDEESDEEDEGHGNNEEHGEDEPHGGSDFDGRWTHLEFSAWRRSNALGDTTYEGTSETHEPVGRGGPPHLRTSSSFVGQIVGSRFRALPDGVRYLRYRKDVVSRQQTDDHLHLIEADLGCRGGLDGYMEYRSSGSSSVSLHEMPMTAVLAHDGHTLAIEEDGRDAAGCWLYRVDDEAPRTLCPDEVVALASAP